MLEAQVLATSASGRFTLTSWESVKTAAISDPEYASLLHNVQNHDEEWPEEIKDYKRHKQDLSTIDGVVTYKGRVVIPRALRHQTLQSLHQAHQGESSMNLRTQEAVWWPNITSDISTTRAKCLECHKNAPTQLPLPPVQPPSPQFPFQMISSDYFFSDGHNYLVVVDRYSNWPLIKKCRSDTAEELVTALREVFCTYGVPEQLTSDGGPSYLADHTKQFLQRWGVQHRVSTSYNPHANLRSETAVKTMKRLIKSNIGPTGTLNTDAMAAALLTYRNTPDRDTQRSPAQVLYGRQLKDTLPCNPEKLKIRPEWILTAEMREKALAKRHLSRHTDLLSKSRPLKPLELGCTVQVQNQRGPHANKWDLSGTVVESQPFDSYLVKMDGTGRITKRNRRFLRPIVPFLQQPDRLPLQRFNEELTRSDTDNTSILNTSPTADRREATTSCPQRLRDTLKSGKNQPTAPDTQDTEIQMSDDQFNNGLMRSVRNVQRVHQNMDTPIPKSHGNQLLEPDTQNTVTKRVRFPTKRLIEQ